MGSAPGRWNSRQAVLTNIKDAGKPVLESDFPPGSDTMGEILRVLYSDLTYLSGEFGHAIGYHFH